jgi:transcription termination factor Rho
VSTTEVINDEHSPQDVDSSGSSNPSTARKRGAAAGLPGMLLPELRALAVELGITGITGMRKGDLIAAIKTRQSTSRQSGGEQLSLTDEAPASPPATTTVPTGETVTQAPTQEAPAPAQPAPAAQAEADRAPDQAVSRSTRRRRNARGSRPEDGAAPQREQSERPARQERSDRNRPARPSNNGQQSSRRASFSEDDDSRRRFRDRRREGTQERPSRVDPDTEVREDDVLLPVAGILDILENYAFVRTSGYLAGPNDVYVSLSLVRRYGLRRGDAVTGVVRQPRDGEQARQKFNPMVRVDSINGIEPDAARQRPEFQKLTPLYPNERLRLETESNILITRVIDLVMPVGKGQRALIVSPPKAGKTSVLQAIANAITTNNPECYLMVVLVDERPEEVTDMQRSVKGEVIASTFDRPPSDHTTVAELSIERAKRLVEMGNDVVVLLDSITRLGRAYNLAAPASGRILSGGVDSTALFPPKRFLGAARNIEGGGSLTIFATALVETGSTGDSVIFEEFKGTGNAELKLDRKIAERRVFPAVDVIPSGTRKEELLLAPDELAIMHKLNRVLHALDSQQAIDLLLDRLRKTKTNYEFLVQIAKSAPGQKDA